MDRPDGVEGCGMREIILGTLHEEGDSRLIMPFHLDVEQDEKSSGIHTAVGSGASVHVRVCVCGLTHSRGVMRCLSLVVISAPRTHTSTGLVRGEGEGEREDASVSMCLPSPLPTRADKLHLSACQRH